MKILILFGHPAYQRSIVNKALIQELDSISELTFHDLYAEYPELDIDIDREQQLLLDHDCIIFQFPMLWYSTPAIFKEWQDLVLEHGWAYGSEGTALKGKLFFTILTTGAPIEAYKPGGMQNFTIQELLVPITQTATRCNMSVLPPFVAHGAHHMPDDKLNNYCEAYRNLLVNIASDKLDIKKTQTLELLNHYKED